jgi:hypothetical protein
MGALVLYISSNCPHIQTPKVIWFQNGAHIKLIRDAPFSEPSFMSLKKSRKMDPLQVLQRGPLWRELPVSRAFFYMSLDFILKVLLINRNFTLLSTALGKECPHVPQNGDPTETDAHFQSLT